MWKQRSDISFRLHINPGFGPLALHNVPMAFLLHGATGDRPAARPRKRRGSRLACGDVLEGAWVISVRGITSVGKNFG
jgi:hypothetical protein